MNYKIYIDIFSALLTPLIAIITTYLAIRQYKINRAKTRHELYDKRLAVFKTISSFLFSASCSEHFDFEGYRQFSIAKQESYFLFDKDITDYLDYVLEHVNQAYNLKLDEQWAGTEDRNTITHKKRDVEQWCGKEANKATLKFMPYLDLKGLR
jgi:hypothetical protein